MSILDFTGSTNATAMKMLNTDSYRDSATARIAEMKRQRTIQQGSSSPNLDDDEISALSKYDEPKLKIRNHNLSNDSSRILDLFS